VSDKIDPKKDPRDFRTFANDMLAKDEENFRSNRGAKIMDEMLKHLCVPEHVLEGKSEPEPEKTVTERAKDLLEQFAKQIENQGPSGDAKIAEIREVADNLLAEDQYEAVVIVLARLSGKPKRLVKRVLKSKLGVTSG
jgi:hypothetical protein